jgi:hypothetical protein
VRVQIPPSAPKKSFSINKLSRLTLHNHCHQTVNNYSLSPSPPLIDYLLVNKYFAGVILCP